MLYKKCLLLFPLLVLLSRFVFAEELVMVNSVSDSKKTFVIRLGKKDGVVENQTSLFSNQNISVKAQATRVTREYSYWKLVDENALITFDVSEIVSFQSDVKAIWYHNSKINTLIDEELSKYGEQKKIEKSYRYVKANLSYTITETASSLDPSQVSNRSGQQFEFGLSKYINPRFNYELGIRYDKEQAENINPSLVVPVSRFFFTAGVLYKFEKYDLSSAIYLAMNVGLGREQSSISGTESSGNCYALPVIRIGHVTEISKKYSFFAELTGENIFAQEEFNQGPKQTYSIYNTKFTLGLLF